MTGGAANALQRMVACGLGNSVIANWSTVKLVARKVLLLCGRGVVVRIFLNV